jgi:endonuclease G, mitochondrial
MNKSRYVFLLLLVLSLFGGCQGDGAANATTTNDDAQASLHDDVASVAMTRAARPVVLTRRVLPDALVYGGMPESLNPLEDVRVIDRKYFLVGYSEYRGNPLWVAYRIGAVTDLTAYDRKKFATYTHEGFSVTHDDYTNSEYQRGHMAPRMAISSRFGEAGNNATFTMDNVSPQKASFNNNQWGNLEEWIAGKKAGQQFIKGWADVYGPIWVIVGPVFDSKRQFLPTSRNIEIPDGFYCIVLRIDAATGKPQVLAVLLKHDEQSPEFRSRFNTVDEIERQTKLDFFGDLDDVTEEALESQKATVPWPLATNPN